MGACASACGRAAAPLRRTDAVSRSRSTSIQRKRPATSRATSARRRGCSRSASSRPSETARVRSGARIGYLRAGALLHSTTTEPRRPRGAAKAAGTSSTPAATSARDATSSYSPAKRLPELRARQPDREAVMPYDYVTVRRKTPLYKRLPKADEVYEIPPEDRRRIGQRCRASCRRRRSRSTTRWCFASASGILREPGPQLREGGRDILAHATERLRPAEPCAGSHGASSRGRCSTGATGTCPSR